MTYEVHKEATDAGADLSNVNIDLSSYLDVITLDDKQIDISKVVAKLKQIVSDTNTELDRTQDIEV